MVCQRLLDIEFQEETATLPNCYITLKSWSGLAPASYLTNISMAKYRWAFSRARFNAFPSAVLEGRFQKQPMEQRLCSCNTDQIESIAHILLFCPLYHSIRNSLIFPLLSHFTNFMPIATYNSGKMVKLLLRDKDPNISQMVAKFLYISTRIKSCKVN